MLSRKQLQLLGPIDGQLPNASSASPRVLDHGFSASATHMDAWYLYLASRYREEKLILGLLGKYNQTGSDQVYRYALETHRVCEKRNTPAMR